MRLARNDPDPLTLTVPAAVALRVAVVAAFAGTLTVPVALEVSVAVDELVAGTTTEAAAEPASVID